MTRSWAFVLVLVLGLLPGCRDRLAASAEGPPPSILLVTLCAWRADHVGAWGYSRDTTPTLDGLAERGIRFQHAWAASNWTNASIASIYTARWPFRHGLVDYRDVLDGRSAVLQDGLAARGLATAQLLSGSAPGALQASEGMRRGFSWTGEVDMGAGFTPEPLVTWLADHPGPYLAHVHIRRARAYPFSDDPRPFAESLDPRLARWFQVTIGQAPDPGPEARRAFSRELEQDAALRQSLVDIYDAGLRQADAQLGSLLAALEAAGRLDDTIIVVVADHGEMLGEQGDIGHPTTLHPALAQVPMVIALPGGRGAGRVVADDVSQVDVMPTLLDLVGMQPAAGVDGRSLVPLLEGDPLPPRPALTQIADRPNDDAYGLFERVSQGAWSIHDDGSGGPASPHRRWRVDRRNAGGVWTPVVNGDPLAVPEVQALLTWHEAHGAPDGWSAAVKTVPEEDQAILKRDGYW
ncbi:MAG: hypothetical protein D6798_18690 [Deltaproteobacteria bacterium]|nr:MAG: hypothetical protein D6798_18690 [Deltaproteobacteria bacterium]